MVQSIYKKTLLLIVVTVVLISTGAIMYFLATIRSVQDEQLQKKAREFADIVAINLDIDTLESFKTMVQEAYKAADNKVSNYYMGTQKYNEYISQFEPLKRTDEFRSLYSALYKLMEVSDVDCFYLCFIDRETKCVVYLADAGDDNVCNPGSFDELKGEDLRALEHPNMSLVPSVINNEIYGDIVGSAEPIFNRSRRVIAYVGVDISTAMIAKQLNRLMINTFLTIVILAVLLGAISLFLTGKIMIKPIALHEEMVVESQSLKKENETLARRAQAAEKIAELTGSISSLLTHMPAMTFSKEIETGRYMACNQMFVEFAGKRSVSDIVGHTDEELFESDTANHFLEIDKKAASMEEPYIFRDDVVDAGGNDRFFQTTKLKFKDENGRDCLLGMSIDISELVMAKKENAKTRDAYKQAMSDSITYSNIAMALSSDYNYLYYVDINDDTYTEYGSSNGQLDVELTREGDDFFNLSLRNAQEIIFEEDRERFVSAFTKDKILAALEKDGRFLITYRMILDGRPLYMNLKAVRLENDDEHIIIGVSDVDAQTREKEAAERMKQEQITYERIAALSGRYICIYTVDPETDHFVEFSATADYDSLSLPKEGDDFFEKTRIETERVIYEEDKEHCVPLLTKENILETIERNGLFTIKYRLVIDGEPIYVRLKAALIEEKDGPQILVGVSDIDVQEKMNQEYAANLASAEAKANLDAMTGAYNKHAYFDLESQLNEGISRGESPAFAIVVCDVNGLKQVNDTLGHKAGDELIISAYNTISEVFEGGRVFRVGGDEFAVILMGDLLAHIDDMMKRMVDVSVRNCTSGEVVIAGGMSIFGQADSTVEDVFNRADKAMYENKQWLKGQNER